MWNNFCRVGTLLFPTILMLLIVQTANAETVPTQQNFAFVAELSDGKQSLRQFELPYQILAGLERQDYGDMRIVNSQNQPVPFRISQFEPRIRLNPETHDLRFFRVADNVTLRSGMQIEFSQTSTRFSFNNEAAENADPNYLIIENQQPEDDLHAINLNWQQSSDTFSIKVKLESSDDLQSWQIINDNTTLYDLKHLDAVLIKNTLNLAYPSHAKYLRLSFLPSSRFTLQIDKITGDYQHTLSVEQENWQSFQLEPGEHPNEWLFYTGSFLPVTKVAFQIPAVGLFYQGSLYSKNQSSEQNLTAINRHHSNLKQEVKRVLHHYPEYQTTQPQKDWYYQGGVTQYRLLTVAGEIASEPVSVNTTKDWQWKLVLNQPASLLSEQIPTVKVAWYPVRVTFLAQGKPPYRLYFGNATIAPLDVVLPPMENPNEVETVIVQTIHEVEKLAMTAEAENLAKPSEQTNWRKILLWLLLCGGVLVMSVMAYQLYLRMNQKKD